MRALIFAAGIGERMRPLTLTTPKPLLPVGGQPLIVWHLQRLAAIGVRDVVINIAWLAERFAPELGDGAHWGLRIHYSHEGAVPLETGGGMLQALPLLHDPRAFDAPFLAVNGDIWCDADLASLPREPQGEAHLLLVDNPAHNPAGDFALQPDGQVHSQGTPMLTFAGIGVYRPRLLQGWRSVIGATLGAVADPPRFALAPLLRAAMHRGAVTGSHHHGEWTDVGTPERLRQLDERLRLRASAP